jgi:hypothetical protein
MFQELPKWKWIVKFGTHVLLWNKSYNEVIFVEFELVVSQDYCLCRLLPPVMILDFCAISNCDIFLLM